MIAGAWLAEAAARLRAAGIEEPRREARLLLRAALGPDAVRSLGHPVDPGALEPALARRVAREPLAYITGERGFWSLDLAASPAALIPRADSETLIEAALGVFADRGRVRRVLDLGTGSGCLLLAALAEFPRSSGVGVDLRPEAAALARANARAAGLDAVFVVGDWASAIGARFDLVLCNPPYIRTADLDGLMPEVRDHEPRPALDGGTDGLGAYRALLPGLATLLAEGGAAILELGAGQQDAVAALARQAGLDVGAVRADLGGIARALVLRPTGAAADLKISFGSGAKQS